MGQSTRYLALIVTLFLSSASVAESISGNQFLDLTENQKGWYFLGVLDAIKQTRDTYFEASDLRENEFDRIWESCISGRPVRQHLAIVESWLRNNPNRWHEPAIELIFDAERDSCDELKADKNDGD